MKNIEFKDQKAQQVYHDYLLQVSHTLRNVDKEFKNQLLMEINNHVFEGMEAHPELSELDSIVKITKELGRPKDYLQEVVEDYKLDKALKKFNRHPPSSLLFFQIEREIYRIFLFISFAFLRSFAFDLQNHFTQKHRALL